MTDVSPTAPARTWRALRFPLWTLTVLAVLFVAMDLAIRLWDIPAYLLPTPAAIFSVLTSESGRLLSHTGYTIAAAGTGLALSTVFASVLAMTFVQYRAVSRATFPFVVALRTAPVVAVAPLITLLVGRGFATSVIVVVIVTFFPILVNLMRGLDSPEETALELLHVCGGSRWQQLRMVRIPFSLPYLFTGLRVASTSAILGAMLAEWLTGLRGLGYLILESADMREVATMWSAILISSLIALLVFWLTAAAERHFVSWRVAAE